MRPSRRRGLTLIEVLVAATLGTIIIGVVVSISIQVQRSIGIAQLRTLTTRQVYSFFTDLEHDLARIIPNVPTPSAAGDPGQRPLIIERGTTTVTGNADPAGLVRIVDRIQMWVTNPDATNGAATATGTGTNPSAVERSLVEYSLDGPTTTSSGAYVAAFPAPPKVRDENGGVEVGNLRRRVLRRIQLPGGSLQTPTGPQPLLIDNVIALQIQYVTGAATDLASSASGPTADVYLDPQALGATAADGTSTSDGSAFYRTGNVAVKDLFVTSTDAGGERVLSAIPIGGEVFLRTQTASTGTAPFAFKVRSRPITQGVTAGATNTTLGLADRPSIEPPPDPLATSPPVVTASCFVSPAAIRVTVLCSFGRGPESEMVRFTRVLPVAR